VRLLAASQGSERREQSDERAADPKHGRELPPEFPGQARSFTGFWALIRGARKVC
jgi:hypothetical protein